MSNGRGMGNSSMGPHVRTAIEIKVWRRLMMWEHLNDGMLGKESRVQNCVLYIYSMVLILFETNKSPSSATSLSLSGD